MKILFKLLALAIIDCSVLWLWICQIDPDPSGSIVVMILVPFVCGVNLAIAGILSLMKKREASRLFLINAGIASMLMYVLFSKGIERNLSRRMEEWTFQKADTIFSLMRWKESSGFSMSYSLNPGSSWGFIRGGCYEQDGGWILQSDSLTMQIDKENRLIGFRVPTDTIIMHKIR
ncbi:MAG: hypothetical protein AAF544_02150 [Bacteroidota bacterium]